MNESYLPITVAYGDGIGPEIMDSVLKILKEAEARIKIEIIEIGERLYNKHYTSGFTDSAWESILRTKVLLKSPITTPLGKGFKSLNVILRKTLSLYANVRPAISYAPFIHTLHHNLDIVIIRENIEDLYSGIEYRQTHNVYETLKFITRTGSEKIIRYAFEYAIKNNRKKVTCFSKDNIMKFSDGIFHKVFDEIKEEYPNIQTEHFIIDIGTAVLATKPENFDVIVTLNLYGDILSDLTGELSGSVGLAGSANIGDEFSLFEAIHGSAPKIAGKDLANPSGLLNAAIMMLTHIGQSDVAKTIENAWKKTIEDGIHTSDIFNNNSKKRVGTKEFTSSIIQRLGSQPSFLKQTKYPRLNSNINNTKTKSLRINKEIKMLVGVDVFISMNNNFNEILNKISKIKILNLYLDSISAIGIKLWPNNLEFQNNIFSDHLCCRFLNKEMQKIENLIILDLLREISDQNLEFIKIENLFTFDSFPGFSLID